MKKRKDSPLPIVVILSVIMLIALCWCFAARAQTPGLVVSASASGLTPSLVITSNSSMPWKGFTVLNQSNGTVGVLWAESDGASGGIYYGNVALSVTAAGSSVAPRPAPATDLPLSTLSQATVAAIAGIPADEVTKMAAGYEALATQVDAGTIVSPLQLQLATGTHLLASFDAKSLESFKGFTAAVAGWIDAQQCAGKLTPEHMEKYALVYHAIASGLHPGIAPPQKVGTSKPNPPAAGPSPCANGHCPNPETPRRRFFAR